MSRFPLVNIKDLPVLIFVALWFGMLVFVYLHLLPLFILGYPLIPFPASLGTACLVALFFFFAPLFFLQIDLDHLLSSGLTFGILLGVLYGLYALLLAVFGSASPSMHNAPTELLLLVILACVLGYSPIRRIVSATVERILFSGRPNYYDLFDDISGRMATSLKLADLMHLLTIDLPEKLQITHTGIMIIEEKHSRLYPENLRFGNSLWSQSQLVALLKEGNRFFFSNTMMGNKGLRQELQQIQDAGFAMIYGLQGGSLFGGMLLLGPRKDGRRHTSNDLKALSTLAHQVSIAIENALNFESLEDSNKQLHATFHKLVESKKMAALGEMTATLAHELINPLAIIRSSAQYLVQEKRSQEIQNKLLNYVVEEVDGLNLVISNFLDLARHKPPQFHQMDIRVELTEFVERWVGCEQHAENVFIELDLPDHLPILYADSKQLRQLLMHCLSNSEEAMLDGGTVVISFRELDQQRVEFCISDTGPGIAEDDQKMVFKKFFTTKEKGVGLGLPVCRQIARAHNGSIKLVNNVDQGASVILRLPLRPLVTITPNDAKTLPTDKAAHHEN